MSPTELRLLALSDRLLNERRQASDRRYKARLAIAAGRVPGHIGRPVTNTSDKSARRRASYRARKNALASHP